LLLDIWEVQFAKDFVTNVMIPMMNYMVELGELQHSEFMMWIGSWFLMAKVQGPSRFELRKKDYVDSFCSAPI
jgi:hypothetical protein